MFRSILWLVLLILSARSASAQLLLRASQAGGAFSDAALGLAIDAAGNSYVTGLFEDVAVFGAGEPNETILTSAGSDDVFVAKYDSSGLLIWAVRAGGIGDDVGRGLAVDSSGNSYVTGSTGAPPAFGDRSSTELPTNLGVAEAFVAKYDSMGQLVWTTTASGTDVVRSNDIAIDGAGNSYIIGTFAATAVFGAGEENETELTSAGAGDVFVAKYDASGLLAWATRAGGAFFEQGARIAVSAAGDSFVTGGFWDNATFGAGEPNETTVTSAGFDDVFVARYDGSGHLSWVTRAGGGGFFGDWGGGIGIDTDGNVYVAGNYDIQATFGEGEPNETTLTSLGQVDVFMARYNGSGLLEWVRSAGSLDRDSALDLAVSSVGHSYVTGGFWLDATFGAGEENETVLTSEGAGDAFVAVLDGSGRLISATGGGGIDEDRGQGLAVDAAGDIHLAGHFRDQARFGRGEVNETVLVSAGGDDLFIAKFLPKSIFGDGFETGDTSAWSSVTSAAPRGDGVE